MNPDEIRRLIADLDDSPWDEDDGPPILTDAELGEIGEPCTEEEAAAAWRSTAAWEPGDANTSNRQ